MSHRMLGLLSLVVAAAVIWVLPAASAGQGGLEGADQKLREATQKLGATVQQTLDRTTENVTNVTKTAAAKPAPAPAQTRAPSPTPTTDPPLHGTNPHGQGGIAVADINPDPERPQGGATDGSDSGEEVVVGRSRGEEQADGSYRGAITIAALFGNEILGVETQEGQTRTGPLEPVQQGVLDPICDGSDQQICLSVLTADSTTSSTGSANRFSVANAQLGGADGLSVGAAESQGNISEDANCQSAGGSSQAANVSAGGSVVASAVTSSSDSRSCRDGTQQVDNQSQVLNLGGQGVPLPAPGCGEGTPDTVIEIPLLLTIVCNADTVAGAAGVRDALDVFVLNAGGSSVVKLSTGQAESLSQAPDAPAPPPPAPPECSDGVDNDGDGQIDFPADQGCTSATDDSEAGGGGGAGDPDRGGEGGAGGSGAGDRQCSDGRDNDGDGRIDSRDPGCHTDGNANNPDSFDPNDDSEAGGGSGSGAAACSDGLDNDGDGVIDSRDPGCHTDGNANNPDSYDPNDDSESDAQSLRSGSLPFTGTDVIGLALAGLLLLAGGLILRRRELPLR